MPGGEVHMAFWMLVLGSALLVAAFNNYIPKV